MKIFWRTRTSRTIRELGGEFWAEIEQRISEEEADWKTREKLADILMGVLARHAGKLIENDKDLPVEPLGAYGESERVSGVARTVTVLLPRGEQRRGEFRIWEEVPDNAHLVQLQLRFADRQLTASDEDLFEALSTIRKEIEAEGIRLVCYGCSRNVFPSPMSRSMGTGERAYRLELGKPARAADLVSIFDTGPGVDPVVLAEQEQFYHAWLQSLGSGLDEPSSSGDG